MENEVRELKDIVNKITKENKGRYINYDRLIIYSVVRVEWHSSK